LIPLSSIKEILGNGQFADFHRCHREGKQSTDNFTIILIFVMDFGSALISVRETSRYPKCFSLQIESGNSVIRASFKVRLRKPLNSQDLLKNLENNVRNFLAPSFRNAGSTQFSSTIL
jgi:hypothetical protein